MSEHLADPSERRRKRPPYVPPTDEARSYLHGAGQRSALTAEDLRAFRVRHGVSLRAGCRTLGVSYGAWTQWESGRRKIPAWLDRLLWGVERDPSLLIAFSEQYLPEHLRIGRARSGPAPASRRKARAKAPQP